ncbi:DUF6017 domain-containing protein [Butyrivibrio sp. AC2005]|uniref:DUF6017 domain-containing protein n=1 Tax=Butyrivibrio sp. AC2005 TaxID=1280672 RepID=UPI00040F16A8|nr:DUF6017 domain-containing protein [Butyrivibrio sp. AC2005]
MGKKLDLNYFYGQESDQFNFIRIPKTLLYNPMYEDISLEEAVVYSMLLDRMQLSMKNGWYDELGRAYVYCSIETIMEFANCGKNKAGDFLKKLDAVGLIEKVLIPGRGLKIYVKNFILKEDPTFENQILGKRDELLQGTIGNSKVLVDNSEKSIQKSNNVVCFLNDPIQNSNVPETESKPIPVYFSNTNNTKTNNNNLSNNLSNQPITVTGPDDAMGFETDEQGYAELIRENIGLDSLMAENPHDREFLQGLYDLILETVLCQSESIVVASNKYSSNFVKAKMLKLNKYHIEYVMDCWKNLKDVPRNVRKYMLAALFNAPSTCDAYIQVEVNRDMADPNAPWKIANVD